jgi:hypothetical protein
VHPAAGVLDPAVPPARPGGLNRGRDRRLGGVGQVQLALALRPGNAAVAWVDNRKIRQSTWGGAAITDGTFGQFILVSTVPGDVNLDEQVTQADYAAIVANMGRTNVTSFDGDLNFDDVVNGDDFAIVTAALAGGGAGAPLLVTSATQPVAAQPTDSTPIAPAPVAASLMPLYRRVPPKPLLVVARAVSARP